MTGRYEISVSFDGYYNFALFVGSGSPLLEGQEHSTLPLCRKGIASVRLNCDAPLEDMCADEDAPSFVSSFVPYFVPDGGGQQEQKHKAMKCPKFVLDRSGGMYRVTLYAKNGKPVAATPEIATRDAALEALERIRTVARTAHTTEPTNIPPRLRRGE